MFISVSSERIIISKEQQVYLKVLEDQCGCLGEYFFGGVVWYVYCLGGPAGTSWFPWRSFCLDKGVVYRFCDDLVFTDVITPWRSVGAVC
jgi:hypothetical protein